MDIEAMVAPVEQVGEAGLRRLEISLPILMLPAYA